MIAIDSTHVDANDRRCCGYEALGYAIIEQAVFDFRALRRMCVITADLKVVDPWPKFRNSHGYMVNMRYLNTYQWPHDVRDLIEFVTGADLNRSLAALDSRIDPQSARVAVMTRLEVEA